MNRCSKSIDINMLRADMQNECLGAYFAGGLGVALFESFDIDGFSPEKLIDLAKEQGIDLDKYRIQDD